MYDGTLKFDTAMDTKGFQKGADSLGNIVKGLGIFEILKKGLQMIAAQLDAVMNRLDTMDQFNRVMTTMTGSTDKANAALKKTNDIVTGTAYGLDVAARAVQAFVSSGMEVNKATATVAAWGDAVAFYGDGTNASLSSVTDALTKMGTKGNVTMEHMQILLNAGIPAIEIYAQAMGMGTEEVTAAMSKGELSATSFISVMNDAFNTGAGGFPAIAGAAKEAGSSWAGSIDNMKAAVTRGVASVLTSFDEMFKVKSGMVSFGKGIESVMKGLADNMTFFAPTAIAAAAALVTLKVAPSIATGLGSLAKAAGNAKAYLDLAAEGARGKALADVGATGAEMALASVMALGNVIKAAAQTVTLALTGATWADAAATAGLSAAWTTLSAVISASPLGWILALIVAVVAAIAAIVNAVKNANKEYYAEKDALKELSEAHEEYADSLRESKDAAREEAQEKIAAAQANNKALHALADLVDENGKYTESAEEAQHTVNQLNNDIEGLGLTFDETTGQINMSADELREYGDNLEAITRAEAAQSEYNNILSERNSLQAKRNALEEKVKLYNEWEADGTLTTRQANKLRGEATDLLEEYDESLNELEADVVSYERAARDASATEEIIANRRQDIMRTQESDVKKLSHQYGVSFDQILDEASKLDGGLEAWSNNMAAKFTSSGMDLDMLAEKWGMTAAEVQAYCDEWGMSYDEFNEHMKATHTAAGEDVNDLAAKWGVSAYEIEKWIAMNESDLQGWSDMMEEEFAKQKGVYDGYFNAVTDGFSRMEQGSAISMKKFMEDMEFNQTATNNWADNMTALMAAGVDAGVIAKLHKMGDEGKATAQLWVEELTEMNDGTDIALGGLNETAQGRLDELSGVMSTGATTAAKAAQTDAVIQEYVATGGNYADAVTAGYTANDTLPEQTQASGLEAGDSLGAGMESSTAPTAAAQEIADNVVANLSSADFSAITTGIANAIRSGTSAVTSAASSMSTSTQSIFRTMSTQTQSIAQQMMTAINSAITSRTGTIRASATAVATAIATALQTMVEKGETITEQMMTGIYTVITTRTATLKTAATAIATGIETNLKPMIEGCKSVMNSAMDGMLTAMNNKAPTLYAKAKEIADNIAKTMKTALDVHSPSRVMIKIFEFVMMGIYKGMDGLKGLLYKTAEGISTGIGDRLAISPDVAASMTSQLRDMVDANPFSEGSLTLAGAAAGAYGGVSYSTNLNQFITTPKPLSPSEMTREGQDLLRRTQWQLP